MMDEAREEREELAALERDVDERAGSRAALLAGRGPVGRGAGHGRDRAMVTVSDDEVFESVTLPCVECGDPVFQRTARVARYCSKRCRNRAFHRRHPEVRGTETHSVTVTYTDAEGVAIVRVGYGTSKGAAREDADAQLPRGFAPVRSHSSTVGSILRSLQRTAS